MRRMNMTMMALIGGLVLLLLLIAYFTTNRDPAQDKLSDSQITAGGRAPAASGEKSCAAKSTYDLIKRELFRRAAQLRGSDAAAFDRLSAYSVVRMENPVMESEDSASRAVQCSGSLSLDLPPGVAVVGGRRTLMSGIDYSVQPAADGSGSVVLLRNADSIIAPLATLARMSQPAAPTATQTPGLDSPGQPVGTLPPAPAAPPVPQAPPAPPQPVGASPSFDCAKARSRGEIAVCAQPTLAALDRQMAAQFNRAYAQADPAQRAVLQRTRSGFLGYRDSCRSDACIADAYNGRMREIGDILAGRWRPSR